MSEKIVGIDVDGVLADFDTDFIARIKSITGRDLFPENFQVTKWLYPQDLGYTDEDSNAVWSDIIASEDFWANLLPYPETEDFLWAIGTQDNVYYITQRPGNNVKAQTENWLNQYGVSIPTVLIVGKASKGMLANALNLDYYIDDKNENCTDVRDQSANTKGYMLARPWNHEVLSVPRINTLKEFLDVIQST